MNIWCRKGELKKGNIYASFSEDRECENKDRE